MAAPNYRVLVLDGTGANFSAGNLIADFDKAKNVGWADYLLDVPEAFFTINQDDAKVLQLRGNEDVAHVRIYRDAQLVWAGYLGEHDANEDDVIFYAYGYLSVLYFLQTDWNVLYTNAQINTIVSDQWTRAQTTLTSSLAGWMTTGTIEAPVTTSGGATPIVLPTYKLFRKRILFVLRELAALGIGDTTNTVMFEITPGGVFNFWKNRGVDTSERFEYGDGRVKGFSDKLSPVSRRNDIIGVGINPNQVTLQQEVVDTTTSASIATIGRRAEPVFFSWVRDSVEMDRVMRIRAARAKRTIVDLQLRFFPNSIVPPGGVGATFKMSDRVWAKVKRGITNVDAYQMVQGVQVFWIRGAERVNLLLGDRPGQ